MRFWLITVGEPLPELSGRARMWRTGMLTEELLQRGHEVTWWTSSVDHFNKRHFVTESARRQLPAGGELQFLHGRLYKKNISVARLLNHLEIAREFRRLSAQHERPDLILSSYPTIELCDEAVDYGRRNSVPVLLDIRDLWPDEVAARLPRPVRAAAPWILWPMYNRARRAIGAATGITAISQTYLSWARQMGGRREGAADRWVPMGYRPLDTAAAAAQIAAKMARIGVDPARRTIWFCGTFVGSIDLATAIQSARILAADPSLQFVFTGSGEYDAVWRAQARDLPNVVFTGWLDGDEIAWLAGHSWLGLGAYKPGALMSLPNKLFEYMSAGLPVLSSLEGEARALVERNCIGAAYRAGDAADLAQRIRELAADDALRATMAANALRIFQERFTAAAVYRDFADHLERCARRQGQPAGLDTLPGQVD